MAFSEPYLEDDIHPIDIVEHLAEYHDWDFDRLGDDQIARNVSLLQVEPGKFSQQLVRGEIDFDDYGTVEAHCRIDLGPVTVVPYTLLPPVA